MAEIKRVANSVSRRRDALAVNCVADVYIRALRNVRDVQHFHLPEACIILCPRPSADGKQKRLIVATLARAGETPPSARGTHRPRFTALYVAASRRPHKEE